MRVVKDEQSPQKFWWINSKFEKVLFAKVSKPREVLPAVLPLWRLLWYLPLLGCSAFGNWLKMNNSPQKFWGNYWKFEKFLFMKVSFPKVEVLPAVLLSWYAINLIFASLWLLSIWEYGEYPINFSDTHSCSCKKIICGFLRFSHIFRALSKCNLYFFYCLKVQLTHSCLVFSIQQKVWEISRNFLFWWFYNYFCCGISVCLFFSVNGIFDVAVCNQVNS